MLTIKTPQLLSEASCGVESVCKAYNNEDNHFLDSKLWTGNAALLGGLVVLGNGKARGACFVFI